jgi:hypothetical protein
MTEDESNETPIDKALNIGPLVSVNNNQAISSILAKAEDNSAMEDFTFSRANIREVIENGTDAISKLAVIADQSQHPRAFEVLAKLMDTVVDASGKLMDLQKSIKDLDKSHEMHGESSSHVTNQLFVGSTSQLAEFLKNQRNA